jgi:pimeloyl-ACP methyl ester carboxylesterase
MTQNTNTHQPSFPSMHVVQHDGVRLAYTEAGKGSPPIVLIHGWLGDHTAFAPQFDYFQQTHRTIAVDLRGHGESDKPEQEYTVASFADDISWLCAQLDVVAPIIIGHSMGGNIALSIAAHDPNLAAAIVLIETAVFPLPVITEHIITPVNEGLLGPDYREVIRQAIAGLFLPLDDQELKAHLVEQAVAAPQYVAQSAFRSQTLGYDSAALAAACKVPIAYIAASTLLVDLTPFRTQCPQLVTSQVMQSGHYAQLLVPEQVNMMIERFLSIHIAVH